MNRLSTGTLDLDKEDVLKRLTDVINRGMLSSGPELIEFEKTIAEIHTKKYGIFVNSGQSALETALMTARSILSRADTLKVLVPASTYAATLWAVLRTPGFEPVFCDIDPETFCIAYDTVTADYDIALPVDLCGYPASRPPDDSKLVIEDACQAIGNPHCTYGDIICFSFYVSHHITTGGGGMLCLNNIQAAEYAKNYIAHGRTYGGDFIKYTDKWVDRFLFSEVGSSYRSDCIHAAIGLSQVPKLQEIIGHRRSNARVLVSQLRIYDLPELQLPTDNYIDNCTFQFCPFVLADGIDRTKVLQKLFTLGVDSRVLFPLTVQPAFKRLFGDIAYKYPVSSRINSQGFIVGCHQHMQVHDILYMAKSIKIAVEEST